MRDKTEIIKSKILFSWKNSIYVKRKIYAIFEYVMHEACGGRIAADATQWKLM